jgi:peptidoglycan/LPS O-acetylase OafA/YrhL
MPDPLEHTWSLCVEEHFYLLWPFVIAVLPRARAQWVLAVALPFACLASAIAYAACFENTLAAELIYMTTATRILSLSLGASLAFEERDGRISSAPYAPWLVGLGIGILGGAYAARKLQYIAGGGAYWCLALCGYAALSRGLLTAVVLGRQRWLSAPIRALKNAPLRYIGRISYGLYLYHYLVLFGLGLAPHLVEKTGVPVSRLLLALGLTLLIAIASYELLEKPLLRLRPTRGAAHPADAETPATQ